MYAIDEILNNPDLAIVALTQLKEERERRTQTQFRTYAIDESRSVMHTYWAQKGRFFLQSHDNHRI